MSDMAEWWHDPAVQAAWTELIEWWRRYCADPSPENRRRYYEEAVPKWQKARGDA